MIGSVLDGNPKSIMYSMVFQCIHHTNVSPFTDISQYYYTKWRNLRKIFIFNTIATKSISWTLDDALIRFYIYMAIKNRHAARQQRSNGDSTSTSINGSSINKQEHIQQERDVELTQRMGDIRNITIYGTEMQIHIIYLRLIWCDHLHRFWNGRVAAQKTAILIFFDGVFFAFATHWTEYKNCWMIYKKTASKEWKQNNNARQTRSSVFLCNSSELWDSLIDEIKSRW